MNAPDYPIVIEALSAEDGGFLAHVPDLLSCMSDGETREEAASNVEDAIACWIEDVVETGRQVPAPIKALKVAS